MEARVKHLTSVYPYSKFVTLKAAFDAYHRPGGIFDGVVLSGLCIKPIRSNNGGASGSYTDSFEVVPIGWGKPVVDAANPTVATPGPLSVFEIDKYATQAFPNAANNVADSASKQQLLDSVKVDSTQIKEVDAVNKVRYYDKTSEFEYVFIDIQTFEYLAKDDSNSFYVVKNGGLHVSADSTIPFLPSARGLLLSRAFMVMREDTGADGVATLNGVVYTRYRSLRFAPYPEPKMESTETRPALAYYIGPPCPPVWRSKGAVVFEVSEEEAMAMAISMPKAALQITQLPPSDPEIQDCNCVVNKISMPDLHQQLIEAGIIKKEFDKEDVYRFRWWPWILAGVILVGLAVLGTVELVQRLKGGD